MKGSEIFPEKCIDFWKLTNFKNFGRALSAGP